LVFLSFWAGGEKEKTKAAEKGRTPKFAVASGTPLLR